MIKGFDKYLKRSGYSKSSSQSLKHMFGLYSRWLDEQQLELEYVRYQDVLAYVKQLQQDGLKQRTIKYYLNAVSTAYDYLQSIGYVAHNPVSMVKVYGIKRRMLYARLETTELNEFYNTFPKTTIKDKMRKAMVGFLCLQGITTRELADLTVHDLDFEKGEVYIRGSRRSNERSLKLMSHQVFDLYQYTNEVRDVLINAGGLFREDVINDRDYLIVSIGGRKKHFSNQITALKKQMEKLYPSFSSFRQVRASVITNWLRVHNKRKVQYLAGHRFISSTEYYELQDVEDLRSEIEQYHPFGKEFAQ